MSQFDNAISDYTQAVQQGDARAIRNVLASIPEEQLDEFLHALEHEGAAPKTDLDPARLQDALKRSGMGRSQAQTTSILAAGSFADFIRMRMHENQKGPDTIFHDVIETGDGLAAGEIDDVEHWLEAVVAGSPAPFEISAEAMIVLARAVGSSPETLIALKEHDE